jgi:hypothetical protein
VFLEKCSGNVWTRVARCVSRGLCKDVTGQCDPPQCTPGQFKCEGPDLSRCRDDGTWAQVDTCVGMTMCDAVGGVCK